VTPTATAPAQPAAAQNQAPTTLAVLRQGPMGKWLTTKWIAIGCGSVASIALVFILLPVVVILKTSGSVGLANKTDHVNQDNSLGEKVGDDSKSDQTVGGSVPDPTLAEPFIVDERMINSKDKDLLQGMPKIQKDYLMTMLNLSKQSIETSRLKNPVARQEAIDKGRLDRGDLVKDINNTLARDGVMNWVGNAAFSLGGILMINAGVKTNNYRVEVCFSIPVFRPGHPLGQDLTKDVYDAVKKIDKGTRVRFAIAADAKTQARGSSLSSRYEVLVRPHLLKSLSLVDRK
jgi:hypothetical protein